MSNKENEILFIEKIKEMCPNLIKSEALNIRIDGDFLQLSIGQNGMRHSFLIMIEEVKQKTFWEYDFLPYKELKKLEKNEKELIWNKMMSVEEIEWLNFHDTTILSEKRNRLKREAEQRIKIRKQKDIDHIWDLAIKDRNERRY